MKVICESISIRRERDDELGVFIYAVATLTFEENGTILVQELRSGGLGDVQGDEAYLVLVGEEQRAELVEMLATLGLGDPDEEGCEHCHGGWELIEDTDKGELYMPCNHCLPGNYAAAMVKSS